MEKNTQEQYLSIKMKLNVPPDIRKIFKTAIIESQNYKDKINQWVCANLTRKIGNVVLPHIKNYDAAYYKWCDEHKDEPLYTIFAGKKCSAQNRNNALYCAVDSQNIDGYTGNSFGFTASSYRRMGCCNTVFENYSTKMATLKPKIKKKTINDDSSVEDIQSQVLYEMFYNGRQWSDPKKFAEHIEYMEMKACPNEKALQRMKVLYEYYKDNTELINTMAMDAGVEALVEYAGLQLNRDKYSMSINEPTFSISRLDASCTYILHIVCGKQTFDLKLWGC